MPRVSTSMRTKVEHWAALVKPTGLLSITGLAQPAQVHGLGTEAARRRVNPSPTMRWGGPRRHAGAYDLSNV
jgi:hypothetical protein